jgi:invasion protein IalB
VKGRAISLVVNFGTGRKLDADVSVQVDQDQPIHVPIRECYRFGCRGELNIDDDFVERLKRSSTVTMEATTTDHERLTLSFSLGDFARTYDGPGLETPVLELTQEEMRQRAAQFRPLPQCEN